MGSPISADVFHLNQQQQATTLRSLWTAPETRALYGQLADDAGTREAVLMVTRFQSIPLEGSIQAEIELGEWSLDLEAPLPIGSLFLKRLDGATAVSARSFASGDEGSADQCSTRGQTMLLDVLASPVSGDIVEINQDQQATALTTLWTAPAAVQLLAELADSAAERSAVLMVTRFQALRRNGSLRAEVELGEWNLDLEAPLPIGSMVLSRQGSQPVQARFVGNL